MPFKAIEVLGCLWRLLKSLGSPLKALEDPSRPWKTQRRSWKIIEGPGRSLKALDDSWTALEGHGRPQKSLKGPDALQAQRRPLGLEGPGRLLECPWRPGRLRAELPPVKYRDSLTVVYLLCRMTSGLKPGFKDCAVWPPVKKCDSQAVSNYLRLKTFR